MSLDRYPFLAHEILNCEISQLLEKFFEAPEPKKKEPKEKSKSDDADEDGVCTVDLGASSEDRKSDDEAAADDGSRNQRILQR